jgi:hypothetical protein
MIRMRSNVRLVTSALLSKLGAIRDPRPLMREVAIDINAMLPARIHEDGLAADGQPIGKYSKSYMAVRTGAFKNAAVTKKGKRKDSGTYTDRTIRLDKKTGVFTGEEKVGSARPNYNRTSDTKIIVSLTRQLENDWSVIPTTLGWAIGFKNQFNAQKLAWVEQQKNKKIGALMKEEKEYAIKKLRKLVNEKLA